jgi:integrase
MMEQFGLRIRESVLIKPKYSDSGTNLAIEEGTKGKRTRNVPILTGQQRIVLDRAAAIAKMTKNGNLIPSGKTEIQAVSRIYYVCKKFGITKDQLNITPHGLRHGYANDRYEEVSGMPSSVRGKPVNFDSEKDLLAREVVTRELGHARTSITAAYTGSRVQGRPPLKSQDVDANKDAGSSDAA